MRYHQNKKGENKTGIDLAKLPHSLKMRLRNAKSVVGLFNLDEEPTGEAPADGEEEEEAVETEVEGEEETNDEIIDTLANDGEEEEEAPADAGEEEEEEVAADAGEEEEESALNCKRHKRHKRRMYRKRK